jgi:hypothetical protein
MSKAVLIPSGRLTHTDARAQVNETPDAPADLELREALDAHLVRCSPCRAYALTLQAMVELVRQLPKERAPARLRRRLLRLLDQDH